MPVNVVLVGASGAGKSALIGALMTEAGEPVAQRGPTTRLEVHQLAWQARTLNLLDTPGSPDFWADTRLAVPMADVAVLVVDGDRQVEVGTRRAWQELDDAAVPGLVYVREEAAGFEVAKALKEAFQRPFAWLGADEWQASPSTRLIEACCDLQDQLLERYLAGESLDWGDLLPVLAEAVAARRVFPVVSGARTLFGALQALAPTKPPPKRLSDGQSTWTHDLSGEKMLAAYVFKTWHDAYQGRMSLVKLFSGTLKTDDNVFNGTRGGHERTGKLLALRGSQLLPVDHLEAGDIGVIAKLKEARTGDTLLHPQLAAKPFQLFRTTLPPPLYSVALTPVNSHDDQKLATALHKLQDEDPSLKVAVEALTHRPLLQGLGQRQIDLALDQLQTRFGIPITASDPQVPYRETITRQAEAQGKHKKQTGGHGQYGDVWLRLEPLPSGMGFQFESQIVGGVVPKPYVPAVEKGVRELLEEGGLAGYPITDVKVTLYDGSHHPVDSSELAFKLASHLAFKKAFQSALPQILEPILLVQVAIPENATGDVMSDLNGRRGRILGIDAQGQLRIIKAHVPLAELLHYSAVLTSLTRGQGSYDADMSHYEAVPPHLAQKLLQQPPSAPRA